MKLSRNIILALFVTGLVVYIVARQPAKIQQAPKPSPTPEAEVKPLYDVGEVTEVSWSYRDKTENFKKAESKWIDGSGHSLGEDTSWAVVRRAAVLAKPEIATGVTVAGPWGHFSLQVKNEKWEGDYNGQSYAWTAGPMAGKGMDFSSNSDLKDLFGEGLFGFQSHDLKLCSPANIKEIDFKDEWVLQKEKSNWVIQKGKDTGPAREPAVESFLARVCSIAVESYVAAPETNAAKPAPMLKIITAKNKTEVTESGKIYLCDKAPAFRSQGLDDLMTTSFDDIKDPSLEEGRIALDPLKTTPERLAAIRKIKDMRSVEGLPAMKALVFEKTDLDVYRYEAVDALAAIGTKEAFKIIADRLAQVGRSGFELRLARALASAMGEPFRSDEKTSEDIRRPEVNALLEAYKKHPPGK